MNAHHITLQYLANARNYQQQANARNGAKQQLQRNIWQFLQDTVGVGCFQSTAVPTFQVQQKETSSE